MNKGVIKEKRNIALLPLGVKRENIVLKDVDKIEGSAFLYF